MDALRSILLGLIVTVAASCGKGDSKQKEATSSAEPTAADEGSAGTEPGASGAASPKAPAANESKVAHDASVAAVTALKIRTLDGPFASLEAYCEKSNKEGGEHAWCHDELPDDVDGPLVLQKPVEPFAAAQVFTEGFDDTVSWYESSCSLAIRVESGWFVLPAQFDCWKDGGTPGKPVRLAVSKEAADSDGRRVLLFEYQERRNDSADGVSTKGTQKSLVVCGVADSKRVACLDELLLVSDVERTTSSGKESESYALDYALSGGKLEIFKTRGEVPAAVKLGAYPLRFSAGSATAALTPAPDALATYRTHMRAGRKLVRAKRYSEAVKELEIAVSAGFGHRAHSELGYAAYKAGDLAKARKASAEGARAGDPRIAAGSLYNLGLVHEAAKRTSEAVQAYQRSLVLRPSQAVHDRLVKLRGSAYGWGPRPECSDTVMKEPALKKCLGDGTDDGDESYPTMTGVTVERKGDMAVVHVLSVDGHEYGSERYFLARVRGDQLRLLTEAVYDEVQPDTESSFEIVSVGRTSVDQHPVLRVDAVHRRGSDADDPNAYFVEQTTRKLVFFCDDAPDKPRCREAVPSGGEWSARLGPEGTEPRQRELFAEIYDAEAPTSWAYELDVSLDAKGVVHLKSGKGVRKYVAEQALLAAE